MSYLLGRRIATWHCEKCLDRACEVSAESEEEPTQCPFGHVPIWRMGRWRRH